MESGITVDILGKRPEVVENLLVVVIIGYNDGSNN